MVVSVCPARHTQRGGTYVELHSHLVEVQLHLEQGHLTPGVTGVPGWDAVTTMRGGSSGGRETCGLERGA